MSSTTLSAVHLLHKSDSGWDAARRTFNLALDQQPAAIAQPDSAVGVQIAVAYAGRHGLRIAAQSTGHGAAALGSLADTLLIRTDRMDTVTVDPAATTATAGAGAVWQQVTQAAADRSLTALAGSSPSVGVAGYTLGGGISWLGRRHGLACNQVSSFEVVTADGEAVHVDQNERPDLFWALRGGGGSFAVVTAITMRLLPITSVIAGLLWWPVQAASDVLATWLEMTKSALPDELSTAARLRRMPDTADLPARLRGGSFVVVDAIFLGSSADAETEARHLLAPLLALRPKIDTLTRIPARSLGRLHLHPERPLAFAAEAMTLDRLPPQAVDDVMDFAGPRTSAPLPSLELRHLGGELRRSRPGSGALDCIEADYLLSGGSPLPGSTSADPASGGVRRPRHADAPIRVRSQLRRLREAMQPWAAGQAQLNFTERPGDPASFWPAGRHARLRRIKAAVDPEDRIRSNHPISPAAAHQDSTPRSPLPKEIS